MDRLGPIQDHYKEKLKIKVLKQIAILDRPDFTEADFEKMVENEEYNLPVFDDGFQSAQRSKQKLDELEKRKNEMRKLEKSIVELHDLFVQVAALVDEQGTKTENILHQVTVAENKTEVAVDHMRKAARYAESARKKEFGCWVLTIVAFAGLGLYVYFHLKGVIDGSGPVWLGFGVALIALFLVVWVKVKIGKMMSFR